MTIETIEDWATIERKAMIEETRPKPRPRIIIEVSGGCVVAVYSDEPIKESVLLVDLDGGQVGEPTVAVLLPVETLEDASDIVRECVDN